MHVAVRHGVKRGEMILCQKCGTVNQVGDESCSRCGTRLMIISNLASGEGQIPVWEEHFLERISALEHGIARLEERIDEIYQVMQQLANESFFDHTMIETIVEVLKKSKLPGVDKMEDGWQSRVARRLRETEERERFETWKRSVLGTFRGRDRNDFVHKVEESADFFEKHNFQKGVRSLQKAFALDPENVAIGIFLGKFHYQRQNYRIAGKYLEQVLKENPQNFEANLLIGLLARRRGDFSRARDCLLKAVASAPSSTVAHLALGVVFLSLGEESKALKYFSDALDIKPVPHLHLLLGIIYSHKGQLRQAIRHMKKAVQIDPQNSEAFFQMGLTLLAQNQREKAAQCFKTACRLNPEEGRYRSALNRSSSSPIFLNAGSYKETLPRLAEEGMESLVSDELQLNFIERKSKLKEDKSLDGKD
jgi:tetratricopeptide (TPR) repeat protein